MYPSIITTFNYPTPSDRLNSPSHSALENLQSSTIAQIQTVLGTQDSVAGTLFYDVKSPESDGGGHVQTANKGGTGHTTYTKGVLLVASSASVLTKLGVGENNQVPIADSSASTGIRWGVAPGTKIATSASVRSFLIASAIGVGPMSIMSVIVPGSTLGTTGAIRTTVYMRFPTVEDSNRSILARAIYGNTVVSSVRLVPGGGNTLRGTLQYDLIANSVVGAQRAFLRGNFNSPVTSLGSAIPVIASFDTGSASEDTGGDKVLGFTAVAGSTENTIDPKAILQVEGYIVEKIT